MTGRIHFFCSNVRQNIIEAEACGRGDFILGSQTKEQT